MGQAIVDTDPMAYRFRKGEDSAQGLRRIAWEQLEGALGALSQAPFSDESVHEVRKRLKKLRALLRLVSPGRRAFVEEDRGLREAARALAPLRDAAAAIEVVNGLRGRWDRGQCGEALEQLRTSLRENTAGRSLPNERARAVAAAREQLEWVRSQVPRWSLHGEAFEALRPGLRVVYRQGRKRMRAALSDPTPTRLHEWRKRAKQLWYHIRLLRGAWPAMLDPHKRELGRLGEWLGEDHDLALLGERLRGDPDLALSEWSRQQLTACLAERRAGLQHKAFDLGARLYAEHPKAFAARIGAYWAQWHTGGAGLAIPEQISQD